MTVHFRGFFKLLLGIICKTGKPAKWLGQRRVVFTSVVCRLNGQMDSRREFARRGPVVRVSTRQFCINSGTYRAPPPTHGRRQSHGTMSATRCSYSGRLPEIISQIMHRHFGHQAVDSRRAIHRRTPMLLTTNSHLRVAAFRGGSGHRVCPQPDHMQCNKVCQPGTILCPLRTLCT